jgi:oligopeptide transport system substrate-binding protein
MQAAERRLLADMPIIPLYFYVSKRLVKPWVGGYNSKDLHILAH